MRDQSSNEIHSGRQNSAKFGGCNVLIDEFKGVNHSFCRLVKCGGSWVALMMTYSCFMILSEGGAC